VLSNLAVSCGFIYAPLYSVNSKLFFRGVELYFKFLYILLITLVCSTFLDGLSSSISALYFATYNELTVFLIMG